MKRAHYCRYSVTNGSFKTIDAADTLKEARQIVKDNIRRDKESGFNMEAVSYHIFILNRYTGERLKEVEQ